MECVLFDHHFPVLHFPPLIRYFVFPVLNTCKRERNSIGTVHDFLPGRGAYSVAVDRYLYVSCSIHKEVITAENIFCNVC